MTEETPKIETKFEFNCLQLIQLKELRIKSLRSKYYKVITKENEIKNAESNLLLKTDFKELGLTNKKQRTAFINDALSKPKFELNQLKYELKQEEDALTIINDLIALTIINDLIALRLKEIGE